MLTRKEGGDKRGEITALTSKGLGLLWGKRDKEGGTASGKRHHGDGQGKRIEVPGLAERAQCVREKETARLSCKKIQFRGGVQRAEGGGRGEKPKVPRPGCKKKKETKPLLERNAISADSTTAIKRRRSEKKNGERGKKAVPRLGKRKADLVTISWGKGNKAVLL